MDVQQGTLDLLILKALAWGPQHGYGVSRWLHQQTDDTLLVEDAALYQALHRLERKGYLQTEWGLSDSSRRAKFYALTPGGPDPAAGSDPGPGSQHCSPPRVPGKRPPSGKHEAHPKLAFHPALRGFVGRLPYVAGSRRSASYRPLRRRTYPSRRESCLAFFSRYLLDQGSVPVSH